MSAALKDQEVARLAALTAQVRHDLQCLDYPAHQWVRAHQHSSGQHVYDAVIIGGGQSGLAVAFGLLRDKVDNILVLDENAAGYEGPWITYARMVTLRTPKYLTGPDLGVASLTFRAFWEAQYGEDAWEKVGKIPREEWMRYLRWFRATLEIPAAGFGRGSEGFNPGAQGGAGDRDPGRRRMAYAVFYHFGAAEAFIRAYIRAD
jgi:hypothetical protein